MQINRNQTLNVRSLNSAPSVSNKSGNLSFQGQGEERSIKQGVKTFSSKAGKVVKTGGITLGLDQVFAQISGNHIVPWVVNNVADLLGKVSHLLK
jgi:hypothetical protein